MFNWSDLSNFEISVIVMLIAIWALGFYLGGRLTYLVRLKEIELRSKGLLEAEKL